MLRKATPTPKLETKRQKNKTEKTEKTVINDIDVVQKSMAKPIHKIQNRL